MSDDLSQDKPNLAANGNRTAKPSSVAVRYGRMNHMGEFTLPKNMDITGGKVVIATDRGIELGEALALSCPGCTLCIGTDKMRRYGKTSGGDVYRTNNGRILRIATEGDIREQERIQEDAAGKVNTCRRFAREVGLNIKIVDCEHVLGGERIIFYFLAEERVDFRELVRRLAGEFQTRIEMRQIGARDEARLLADLETCGRECCCKNFLKTLKPITMSMAKLQKTTLDLAKVSGRCGRLKCCLRYEHETYEELNKRLPRSNSWIATTEGIGRVVDRQIICQLVKIRTDDGRMLSVPVENILEWNVAAPAIPAQEGNTRDRTFRSRRPAGRPDPRSPLPETPAPQQSGESTGEVLAQPTEPSAINNDEQADKPQEDTPSADQSTRSRRRRRGKRGRRPRRDERGS
ncbi:MAG: signal peptidase [Phycisphaerales bacterium]|nr:signal peptidase [Phycisphaerales bacterium]